MMSKKLKIKVCGMKYPDNINDILSLDIDFMGFIFYKSSPRYIDGSKIDMEFGNTKKTGVFVNETKNCIIENAKKYNLDYIQLHGNESPGFCLDIKQKGYKTIKVFSINDKFDFDTCNEYPEVCDLFLFDTKGTNPGGNGIMFDWEKLDEYKLNKPFLLSGGIRYENWKDILNLNHPLLEGIDLNSGFETRPGLKDYSLLKEFLDRIKSRK